MIQLTVVFNAYCTLSCKTKITYSLKIQARKMGDFRTNMRTWVTLTEVLPCNVSCGPSFDVCGPVLTSHTCSEGHLPVVIRCTRTRR